jgi:hypothetical protein
MGRGGKIKQNVVIRFGPPVHNGKQKNSNNVNKMPVSYTTFKTNMTIGGKKPLVHPQQANS